MLARISPAALVWTSASLAIVSAMQLSPNILLLSSSVQDLSDVTILAGALMVTFCPPLVLDSNREKDPAVVDWMAWNPVASRVQLANLMLPL